MNPVTIGNCQNKTVAKINHDLHKNTTYRMAADPRVRKPTASNTPMRAVLQLRLGARPSHGIEPSKYQTSNGLIIASAHTSAPPARNTDSSCRSATARSGVLVGARYGVHGFAGSPREIPCAWIWWPIDPVRALLTRRTRRLEVVWLQSTPTAYYVLGRVAACAVVMRIVTALHRLSIYLT